MLIIKEQLWKSHQILKLHSSCLWNKPDAYIITDCVLNKVKSYLQEATDTSKEAILIIDLSKGEFPPWFQVLKMAKFFVMMRNLILSGLTCTVIYAKTENQKIWVDRLLSLYTPAKPTHVVRTKIKIKETISHYRRKTKTKTK